MRMGMVRDLVWTESGDGWTEFDGKHEIYTRCADFVQTGFAHDLFVFFFIPYLLQHNTH